MIRAICEAVAMAVQKSAEILSRKEDTRSIVRDFAASLTASIFRPSGGGRLVRTSLVE